MQRQSTVKLGKKGTWWRWLLRRCSAGSQRTSRRACHWPVPVSYVWPMKRTRCWKGQRVFLMFLGGKGVEFTGEESTAGGSSLPSPLQVSTLGVTMPWLVARLEPTTKVLICLFLFPSLLHSLGTSTLKLCPWFKFSSLWWPPRRRKGIRILFLIMKTYIHSLYRCVVLVSRINLYFPHFVPLK